MNKKILIFSLMALMLILTAVASASDTDILKPYILASNEAATIEGSLPAIKEALLKEGFEVAGEYAPYGSVHLLVITSDDLKKVAAQSTYGGYGAVVRVSLTQVGDKLQVAYTNPLYTALVYRMEDNLTDVLESLDKALGSQMVFGSAKGLTSSQLKKYHYMVMMPYFTDQVKLAKFGSQQKALEAVEAGLAANDEGVSKVYRIDLSGKEESVFGVALAKGKGGDEKVMKVTDTAEIKHSAHLPYELLVTGGTVYMLHGKFRIALSFPDLTMGTFMKISGAPGGIKKSLKKTVKSK
jgi:hypothetical protein